MIDPLEDTDERVTLRRRRQEFWRDALRQHAPNADPTLLRLLALLRAECVDRRMRGVVAETLLEAKFAARLAGAGDDVAAEYDALISCMVGSAAGGAAP